MKLIGDIGGTKVLLALEDAGGRIIQKRRLASVDFSCFETLLADYLGEQPHPIEGGALAVAGPVADDGRRAKITHRPWHIECDALEARFNLGRLTLINDFAGVALGVTTLREEEFVELQPGEPVAGGCQLVLGAGTGLGVAGLWDGRVLASEAGHMGFSPQDAMQSRLHAALLAEHGRVTAEHVVSGPGLAALHRLLCGESVPPEEVGRRALMGETSARQCVDVFFACYGAVAGDLALAFLPRGGVYLAGGVTQKLLPLLPSGPFLEAFNAKAGHGALTARLPVRVVTDPDIGLRGAAAFLRQVNKQPLSSCIRTGEQEARDAAPSHP